MTPTNADLRQFILQYFSEDALELLCLNYFHEVQQNFTAGMTTNRKAILLIAYCETRSRLQDLYAALARERPAAWREKFGAPAAAGDEAAASSSTLAPLHPRLPALPDRRIHEQTGIELIRIPAGPFLYGSADSDEMARDNEKPQRAVELPAYWIGRAPVTNAQYQRFLDAHPTYRAPDSWQGREPPAGKGDHPVTYVSWNDAQAFCDWAELSLPTEMQWEKAARGTDGRLWPWGNERPTAEHGNFNKSVGDTTPVGRYSPQGNSPYGCVDMAGNVWEWTGSWYREGQTRALRGGSWDSSAQRSRAAFRGGASPDDLDGYLGFRVVELLSDPDS